MSNLSERWPANPEEFFSTVAETLRDRKLRPHGPTPGATTNQEAGRACVKLCGNDANRGRTLWKLIARDCGGYMPRAAALALIRAADTNNLVSDVEAPEL